MEKIQDCVVNLGSSEVKVYIFSLDDNDELLDISRVYVIARGASGNIPLIYNSKRDIWGFPGGHVEEGESVERAANRECIEEIQRSISNCTPRFLLLNKIDDKTEEKQIVCFANIEEKNDSLKDDNESVNRVEYLSFDEVKKRLGNLDLWDSILEDFSMWNLD